MVLLHVRPQVKKALAVLLPDKAEKMASEYKQASLQILRHYATLCHQHLVTVRAFTLNGDTGPELVRKANELGAGMLVMGASDKGEGVVTGYCLHYAHAPVTIVRTPIL
jgi:nucleotide-binding universal stress UspA family protein